MTWVHFEGGPFDGDSLRWPEPLPPLIRREIRRPLPSVKDYAEEPVIRCEPIPIAIYWRRTKTIYSFDEGTHERRT